MVLGGIETFRAGWSFFCVVPQNAVKRATFAHENNPCFLSCCRNLVASGVFGPTAPAAAAAD